MRIAVVDDERPARSELVYLIKQCCPDAEITEAESGDKLMLLLEDEEFDVCFVDIELGDANGTTLASMVKSRFPEAQIIFATAYREYAVKAFELGAVDYLLKPFDLERVKKTIDRLKGKATLQGKSSENNINKIMVNAGSSYLVLDVSDILYIETEARSCRIHTTERTYVENESLNYYELRLKNCRFFRIHKSYLVNLNHVLEMVPTYNNGYGLRMNGKKGELLPIGRTQLQKFRRLFDR